MLSSMCKMDEKEKKKTVGEIVTTFRAFEQKKRRGGDKW